MAFSSSTLILFCSAILHQVSFTSAFQPTSLNVLKSTPFLTRNHYPHGTINNNVSLKMAIDIDECEDIGFSVSVAKPLGVVFGENPNPYFGVGIDDVAEGLNGGTVGLRVGDQLLAVNGKVVVGKDFDTILEMLQDAPTNLDLVFYRGTVSMVFDILSNRVGEDVAVADMDDDEEYSGPSILDDDYEPPVIEFEEEKPLSAGDVFRAFGKLGSMVLSSDEDDKPKAEKKKNTGFFGIGGETIQLDGDDAAGTK